MSGCNLHSSVCSFQIQTRREGKSQGAKEEGRDRDRSRQKQKLNYLINKSEETKQKQPMPNQIDVFQEH